MIILMWRIKLVSYYNSIGFMILDQVCHAPNNVPNKVIQRIHAIYRHTRDSSMTCNRAIPYVEKISRMFSSIITFLMGILQNSTIK